MKTVKQLLSQIKKNYMGLPCSKNKIHRSNKEVTKFIRFVNGITLHYSNKLGYTQQEILQALEDKRGYWSANYYQKANFPKINLKNLTVYETIDDFKKDCPSGNFLCPACNSITTDSTICNSGVVINNKKCDWKAFGLFSTLGKGFKLVIRKEFIEKPHVYEMFMPIEKVKKGD